MRILSILFVSFLIYANSGAAVNPENVQDNQANALETLRELANRDCLESVETYRASLNAVLEALNKEDGLIQLQDLPTIVIPDLQSGLRSYEGCLYQVADRREIPFVN